MQEQALIRAAVGAFQQGDLARARLLAEEQLARSDLPILRQLIGLVDCRLGRFESGVEQLELALGADPTNLSYRTNLARALIDAGRAVDAIEVAIPPKGAGAADIELWQVRAEAAFYAGDRATEAAAWRAIANIRPHDPMAWTNLGRSLLSQYQFDEAEEAYLKAFSLTPALTLRHELGLLYERSNQLEKLGALLDSALADGVPKERLADLWALRALRSGNAQEAYQVAQTMNIRPDPWRLNALKAKIADAADRPAEAFAAASAMNWSIDNPGEWRARGRAYREELRAREQAMATWPSKLPQPPRSTRRSPAFIVGFPRSGTTLADTFIRGHADVRLVEEVPLLERAAQALGGVAQLPSVTADQVAAAREEYLDGLYSHVDAGFDGLVIDKMPLSMLSLPLIVTMFPDAKIIFAQRHPCDCVLSGFMQAFVPTNAMASFLDLEDAADLYDAAMRLFFASRERFHVQLHTLIYEDLVSNPGETVRALSDFLGLGWNPGLLDHRSTAARRSTIKTPSYDSVIEPLSKRPIGRWRRYEGQLAPVLPVLLPWAKQLGYGDS